jgi:predicted dienelactone hydrolase
MLFAVSAFAHPAAYNPLALLLQAAPDVVDLTVKDRQRQRDIPIRVYLPLMKTPSPVILFSHGLGGSREGNAYLGKHWAARGFVTVFLQHPGSDTSVWKDKPAEERMEAMQQAANIQNFLLRVQDVPAVLDQLDHWNRTEGHVLEGRLNLSKVGMSGHSFGAITTQAVSGQRIGNGKAWFTDARIVAALIMSPSSPRHGTPQEAFGKVSIPWMVMTGTKDTSLIGEADMESRLGIFPALPAGGKYELVLYRAEHSAFTDSALPGDTEPRNPNLHRAILAISTAFWDTYLHGDAAARDWLQGDGPKSVLESGDRWQMK